MSTIVKSYLEKLKALLIRSHEKFDDDNVGSENFLIGAFRCGPLRKFSFCFTDAADY